MFASCANMPTCSNSMAIVVKVNINKPFISAWYSMYSWLKEVEKKSIKNDLCHNSYHFSLFPMAWNGDKSFHIQ